jgi:hypothetical protein
MPTKYFGRSVSNISRDDTSVDRGDREPSWFGDFVSNLEKNSVKSKSQVSMIDQINNILGNKSKYSSVEEAVLDMQKRTGLYAFLQQKQAQVKEPEIFAKVPSMKTYIDNYVKDRPGTTVDAVVMDLTKFGPIKDHLPESHDVPEDVKHYINKKIMESKSFRPHSDEENMQLGKIDLHVDDNVTKDNDPFGGCMPNKDSVK